MAVKKKSVVGAAIALALVAGIVYVCLNFGSLITRTAEKIATNALGVNVNIGSIDVSLSEKKVVVNSIKISNPPGYRQPYAMTADGILIGLNTASRELIDFKNIQVKGSVVYLEVNEKGINLSDLKKLANSKKQKESVGSEQIRVIVKNMAIDASVVKTTIAMVDRDIPAINVPALEFSNIGSGKGIDAKSAIVQVLTKYFSSVENEARKSGALSGIPNVDDAKKELNKKLDSKAEDLKKKLFR